jgi:hypothetical protein
MGCAQPLHRIPRRRVARRRGPVAYWTSGNGKHHRMPEVHPGGWGDQCSGAPEHGCAPQRLLIRSGGAPTSLRCGGERLTDRSTCSARREHHPNGAEDDDDRRAPRLDRGEPGGARCSPHQSAPGLLRIAAWVGNCHGGRPPLARVRQGGTDSYGESVLPSHPGAPSTTSSAMPARQEVL